MLKKIKQNLLRAAKNAGAFERLQTSSWRQQRLLILGYHGISLRDEHCWNNHLFAPPSFLRRRFEIIKRLECSVLPLGEAASRLFAGTLPPNSVVITFDDGLFDFYKCAVPLLQEFDFPATVFLSTFYCEYERPVFDPALDYLLWKASDKILPLEPLIGQSQTFDLGKTEIRRCAGAEIKRHAAENGASAAQKDLLLAKMCDLLDLDYEEFCRSRVLQLMNRAEVESAARAGFDVQLHTHRHRVPFDETLFAREINDNRRIIESLTNRPTAHFCYPSGVYDNRFPPWLQAAKVELATTGDTALATAQTDPFLLPRLIDTVPLSEIEFAGWLAGFSQFLPQR